MENASKLLECELEPQIYELYYNFVTNLIKKLKIRKIKHIETMHVHCFIFNSLFQNMYDTIENCEVKEIKQQNQKYQKIVSELCENFNQLYYAIEDSISQFRIVIIADENNPKPFQIKATRPLSKSDYKEIENKLIEVAIECLITNSNVTFGEDKTVIKRKDEVLVCKWERRQFTKMDLLPA